MKSCKICQEILVINYSKNSSKYNIHLSNRHTSLSILLSGRFCSCVDKPLISESKLSPSHIKFKFSARSK